MPIFNGEHLTLAVFNLQKGVITHYNSSDSAKGNLAKLTMYVSSHNKLLLCSALHSFHVLFKDTNAWKVNPKISVISTTTTCEIRKLCIYLTLLGWGHHVLHGYFITGCWRYDFTAGRIYVDAEGFPIFLCRGVKDWRHFFILCFGCMLLLLNY